uniref:Max-binding protein MNT n=1 Tax=Oryzias sinensis TaxID=183150 RepID=A0A8C7YM11_9TELE
MSIETLLEAAKFLELQAQQQQKTREEDLKEKLCLQKKTEFRLWDVNYNSTNHINNVSKVEERRSECRSLPLPVATLSPPAAPPLASPKRDPPSPQEQSAAALLCSSQPKADLPPSTVTGNHRRLIQDHHQHPQLIAQADNTKVHQQTHQALLQNYPGPIVSTPKELALLPPTGPVFQPSPLQNGPISRGSPPDDGRQLDYKKRPGGAGTREVHNKLEKNRRAHLKECFETLKKNVPNIDEKKTSNLSVLRSALRYIQTLKRKEKEYEHDMERLAREKIATQQRLADLKNELSQWMDVMEIERVVRQTVQPEEDQVSTSTASEGEDVLDEDMDEEAAQRPHTALPPPAPTPTPSIISHHNSIQNKVPLLQAQTLLPIIPTQAQMAPPPSMHPTVIAHASVSHPSVIQAVNHVIHAGGPKHVAQLAPSTTTSSVQLTPSHQPIGHITVHPVAHLSQHISALYPQQISVTQPAVVGHITSTLNHPHPQVNGTVPPQAAATIVGKQAAVSAQMMAHPSQLVGQTVLNPVTMVTMSSFPISTLKLT